MCIHTGSHILLVLTEVSETQPALASGYKSDNALERSWQQLGAKLLQQFWEHGFWGELFWNDPDASSSAAPTNTLGLLRPVVPFLQVRWNFWKMQLKGFRNLTKGSSMPLIWMWFPMFCTKTLREQRNSMWETEVRRWYGCILSWDGDVAIIGQVKNKVDSKSQCQIVVDVLPDKAPATLLKRCNSISRLVNGLHKDVRVFSLQ